MAGNGKLLPLSQAASVLSASAVNLWQGVSAQHYRLNPTECPTHTSSSYSCVVQLSAPVLVEWQSHGRSYKRHMNPGDVSLHAVGELPGFCLYHPAELFEIVLTSQFVHQVLRGMNSIYPADLINSYGIADPQIQRIAASLQAELEMGCPGGQLFGESLATALTVHVFTQYGNCPKVESEPSGGLSSLVGEARWITGQDILVNGGAKQ